MPTKAMLASVLVGFVVAPAASRAAGQPAARGLDLFIQAPAAAPPGSRLPVQVRVFGFPTVSTLRPLAGAQVEARWDPETLGDGAIRTPVPAAVVCDESGRGHLDIEVPWGKEDLRLLLVARFAGHERARTLDVKRTPRLSLELRVSDKSVVPGGAVSTWVLVRDRVTGLPAADTPVQLSLKEDAFTRHAKRVLTDRSGVASADIPIPFVDDPDWRWTLSARVDDDRDARVLGAEDHVALTVREETPQLPTLTVTWGGPAVAPGARVAVSIAVRDGAGQGLAQLPVRYWVGDRGQSEPADDRAWLAASTSIVTDVDGQARVQVEAPRVVSPRGAGMIVVAKAQVDGRPLQARTTLPITNPTPVVELTPELGALVPGLSQRVFVRATMDGHPLVAKLALEGHGLHAEVHTNTRGFGQASWLVPLDVGASVPERADTDCAGLVAATVHVRWRSPVGPQGPRSFDRCLRVDRDVAAAVRPQQPMVVAGQPLSLSILGAKGSASLVLEGDGAEPGLGTWLTHAESGGVVALPVGAHGRWSIGATGLALPRGKRVLGAQVLVLPKVLPRLRVARIGEGQAAPSGRVAIEAVLDDGQGHPLTGSIGVVVFDKTGGGHPEGLLALDTRRALAASANLDDDRDIDAFLALGNTSEQDGFAIERWAAVAGPSHEVPGPAHDPAVSIDDEIEDVFRRIVQSLEGAVYEASSDPERLRDVRVRDGRGQAINPEMLTLVTHAMSEAPLTPGGEPWQLGDLMTIDPQVRYDSVGKRVARLKLFNVLASLRSYLFEHKLDRDEPILRDPNALVRRMVREDVLSTGALLDPWGHGLRFVPSAAARLPFLSVIPGYRLLSAGPDGRFGTADDVGDPFQRVLAKGTPYAKAVDEDRLVDARWDMRVGEETVEAWKNLIEELTGQSLGDQSGAGGLGLADVGAGAAGYGRGSGTLGGRRSRSIELGAAQWLPPVRTDANGKLRLAVPLGDAETTWQIVVVAVPDEATPASASLEVPTSLPLSVRVDAGASWTVGDEVEVALHVRNRTEQSLSVALQVAASGAVRLVDASHGRRTVTVPARSATTSTVRVLGTSTGAASLEASAVAAGLSDRIRHAWNVKPAGELVQAETAAWIDTSAVLAVPAPSEGSLSTGPGRLRLERGLAPVLTSALDALAPERLLGSRAFADAMEVYARIHAWALAHGGDASLLARRSRTSARSSHQRDTIIRGRASSGGNADPVRLRGDHWARIADAGFGDGSHGHAPACPPVGARALIESLDWLSIASYRDRQSDKACWAALRASIIAQLAKQADLLLLARAVLAFVDMPEQTDVAAMLAARLLAAVPIRPDGSLVLPDSIARHRANRAIVAAALARSTRWWPANQRPLAGRLWSALMLTRDRGGGYGSVEATRYVITTLLVAGQLPDADASVHYVQRSTRGKTLAAGELVLPAGGAATVPLLPETGDVLIQSSSPGLLAELQRPLFRSFLRPVDPSESPLHLDVSIPRPPAPGQITPIHLLVRHELGRQAAIAIRIPLPPGAVLADKIEDITQVQGAVYVRTRLDGDGLARMIEVPIRFMLAGRMTMPEAGARLTDDDAAPARAPARPIVVTDK
jgi:hypothetical protein